MKLLKRPSKKSLKAIIIAYSVRIIIVVAVCILISLTVLTLIGLRYEKQPSFKPAYYEIINEPFTADFYFNTDFETSVFSDAILPAINSAQTSIEIAVYSIDDIAIRDALYEAINRGVEVTLIVSDKRSEGHDLVFLEAPNELKRIDISSQEPGLSGYMHHKFIIIDRREENALLFFGSYNFTVLQEKYDPSFLMSTTRPEVIGVFGEEFDRLALGIYGRKKITDDFNNFAALFEYSDGWLEIWFSPQGLNKLGARQRLISLVKQAEQSVKVLIWYLTDKDIADSLLKASHKIPTTIIVDDFNFLKSDSAIPAMLSKKNQRKARNLTVKTDVARNVEIIETYNQFGINSFLHHHMLLVDDSVVMFGTNNWSRRGFYNNDESIMVSNIPFIVKEFNDVFEDNYSRTK